MEIPDKLKTLYKHWQIHTLKLRSREKLSLHQNVLTEMTNFISERMRIWERRENHEVLPYTNDRILANYRFCNIYRELDKQTITIHSRLKPLEKDFSLWLLNIMFQRMVANPETIDKVGFLAFDTRNNKAVMTKLLKLPRPKYGVAYIFPISLVKRARCANREEFFCDYLPQVIPACAKLIQTFSRESVAIALKQVLPLFGLNFKFHWTEVFIDIAYQFPQYLDLYKDFPVGPGSIPTMLRLNPSLSPEKTCHSLVGLHLDGFPYLTYEGKKVWLSAENWEGIGCEFRKYNNLAAGFGKRRIYKANLPANLP